MAIEIISGEEAWAKIWPQNEQKFWPSLKEAERLHPIATPTTRATFKIHPEEKIFCIGSCFARELNFALDRIGYNALSIFRDLPRSTNRKHSDANMCNKYNVASIYNELSWALNPNTPYEHDRVLIETNNNRFEDYQLTGASYRDSAASAKEFREAFNSNFAKIKEADVVILTLGLSEVWYDKQQQLYLNTTVSSKAVELYPNRFELHIFDYEQTLSFLNAIYELLETNLKPSFRLLITVSPVPLHATFRPQDVFVANSYSKAVLRAVVEEFITDKDKVNYFPSYEFVALSNSSAVWRGDDFRHIDSTFVDYIMGNVMAQFTQAPSTIDDDNLLLKAKALYHGRFFIEAKSIVSSLLKKQSVPNSEVLLLLGAIQLGIDEKHKSTWLKSLDCLKSFRHLNIKALLQGYQRFSRRSYAGHVDMWDGKKLAGWACNLKRNKPIKLKVLVDKRVIATMVADNPRADVADIYGAKYLHSGFSISLDSTEFNNDNMRVVFADTGEDLTGSPIYLTR